MSRFQLFQHIVMFHIIIELIYFNDFVRFWVLFWGLLLSLGIEIIETSFWNQLKITKGRKGWKILFSSLTFCSFCVKIWNLIVQTTDSQVFLFGCHCWYLGWLQGLLWKMLKSRFSHRAASWYGFVEVQCQYSHVQILVVVLRLRIWSRKG